MALDSDGCRGTYNRVTYLEHVQAVITLSASNRGEIEVFLTSPLGTRSTLLARRLRDTSTEGFSNWAFMTTHCWGETASGTWRLEVRNGASVCKFVIYFYLLLESRSMLGALLWCCPVNATRTWT